MSSWHPHRQLGRPSHEDGEGNTEAGDRNEAASVRDGDAGGAVCGLDRDAA